jgi:hypothetical protein
MKRISHNGRYYVNCVGILGLQQLELIIYGKVCVQLALNGYISDGLRGLTQEAILRLHGSQ